MRKVFSICAVIGLIYGVSSAFADGRNAFLDSQSPVLNNIKAQTSIREVCYRSYCADVLPVLREPVSVGEHLTKEGILSARHHSRKEFQFHPEMSLPPEARAELSDYRGSGYDRGHMSPWADAADPDSFSLANIVPQNPDNNRHLWAHIEGAVRAMAIRAGEVYVVTGPIFGQHISMMNGRVAIPEGLYKAVYIPSMGKGAAYVVGNVEGNAYRVVSLAELNDMTHMKVFPSLSTEEEKEKVDLLPPRGE